MLRIPLFPREGRLHQRTQASFSPLTNRSPDRLGQQAITLCGAAFFTAPDHLLCVPQSLNGLAVTLGGADLEAVAPQSINRGTLRRVRDACRWHQCLATAPALTAAQSQNKGHPAQSSSTFTETWCSGSGVGGPNKNRTISAGAQLPAAICFTAIRPCPA